MPRQESPLVSIITPSYNQGQYIQETIDSVLSQDYPNFEYIIVDGGSTDHTVDILQQYGSLGERFRFVSEPDRGQSHAINKGFHMARGSIIGWLNSDDVYLPGAISKAVRALQEHPHWALVYGRAYYMDENSQIFNFYPVEPFSHERLYEVNPICQPAAFFRKAVVDSLGGIDEKLYFSMDYDLWIRISQKFQMGDIEDYLANARWHSTCKSVVAWADIGLPETFQTSLKHYGSISNYFILEYIGNHIGKDAAWLIQRLKDHAVCGPSAQLIDMNRYEDLWAPPLFRCAFQVNPGISLHTIVIKGIHKMPDVTGEDQSLSLSIIVNKKVIVNHYLAEAGEFTLEIPVHCNQGECVIELLADNPFIPSLQGINNDNRELSFIVKEVFALSPKEYDFYCLLVHLG